MNVGFFFIAENVSEMSTCKLSRHLNSSVDSKLLPELCRNIGFQMDPEQSETLVTW